MKAQGSTRKVLSLGIAGALAAALAAGAGISIDAVAGTNPDQAMVQAQKALAKGDAQKAVTLAEAVVAANPRESNYRRLLGQAYLQSGRFDSAAVALDDAMKLGDTSGRTALSLALANIAKGNAKGAVAVLDDFREAIPAADLGLALALAGESGRGVAILADALRAGDKSPQLRQNLAYAFALDGRWREARVMALQDIPADQLDARISDWARMARPEDYKLRVATLINAPLREDPGQPAALALVDSPAQQQLAVEASAVAAPVQAPASAPAVAAELPPAAAKSTSLAQYEPVGKWAAPATAAPAAAPAPVAPAAKARSDFATAFAQGEAPKPSVSVARIEPRVAAQPVAKTTPRRLPAKVAVAAKGTHLIQLGSFTSQQGARRAWGIYTARNPELKAYRMTITTATVGGRQYWRVAAAGFDLARAGGMCAKVRARGGVCFAYSAVRGVQPARVGAPALAKAAPAPAHVPQAAGPGNARRR